MASGKEQELLEKNTVRNAIESVWDDVNTILDYEDGDFLSRHPEVLMVAGLQLHMAYGGITPSHIEDSSQYAETLRDYRKNAGFEDELDVLGFGDLFYSSLLREDPRFTWQRVGKAVVLLEKNRLAFDKGFDYSTANVDNIAFFAEETSKMEDSVKVQFLDGVINVTNISESDIDGEIVIYYKNSATDLYYGGITYRSRVTGGLAKGETRQITGVHSSKTGSALMFVQII